MVNNISKGGFKQLTPGIQEARVARVIDLGLQPPNPKLKEREPKQKLRILFELANDKVEINGEKLPAFAPRWDINLSLGEGKGGIKAKLLTLVQAAGLDVDSVDFKDLIGKAVNVTINEKGFISSVSGLSERVKQSVPPLVAKGYFFDFDEPDIEIVESFSERQIETLKQAVNYTGSKLEQVVNNLPNPDNNKEI